MIIYYYYSYYYHYTGYCVSFIQNTVRIVNVLPNLPLELDVIVLWPSDQDDL